MDYLKAPVILARAEPRATPSPSPDKKPIWLGTALIAAAALILVAVFMLLSFRRGHDVASTDEPLPTSATPDDRLPFRREPREGPRDDLPQDAQAAKPSADSEKRESPADSSSGKTDEGPGAPVPLTTGPNEPPSKGPLPAAEKAKPSEPAQPMKEQAGSADVAKGPKKGSRGPDASAAQEQRLPVPDEATARQALTIIRETYKDDYRTADKVALAPKLLLKAEGSRGDPAARFALLQEAKKVALETGQPELALEAADALTDEYQVPAAEMKAQIVKQTVKMVRYAQQRQAMAEFTLQVLEEAVAEDNFDVARRMGRQASQLARQRRTKSSSRTSRQRTVKWTRRQAPILTSWRRWPP